MPYTSIARSYLLNEGIDPDKIIKVGSPMNEVLLNISPRLKKGNTLNKFKLIKDKYFLVSFHREENILDPRKVQKFVDLLDYLAKEYKQKVIVSTHFRTKEILKQKNFQIIWLNFISHLVLLIILI